MYPYICMRFLKHGCRTQTRQGLNCGIQNTDKHTYKLYRSVPPTQRFVLDRNRTGNLRLVILLAFIIPIII